MANTALRSSTYICKASYILGVLSLLLLIHNGVAFEFKIGGSNGWSVPSNAQSYTQWAEKSRFQIGDTLLFVYSPHSDSVLQVNKQDYANCSSEKPIAIFSDGHTAFKFNQSGPFYFISGIKDNCLKNEKLTVVVLADRSNRSVAPSSTDTPPSPAPVPSSDEDSSPPTGSVEINPTPAPTSDQTPPSPPSGASSVGASVTGLFGAFLSSSLFFAL